MGGRTKGAYTVDQRKPRQAAAVPAAACLGFHKEGKNSRKKKGKNVKNSIKKTQIAERFHGVLIK